MQLPKLKSLLEVHTKYDMGLPATAVLTSKRITSVNNYIKVIRTVICN